MTVKELIIGLLEIDSLNAEINIFDGASGATGIADISLHDEKKEVLLYLDA